MADVTYRDLCFEMVRPQDAGVFWGRVLGLRLQYEYDQVSLAGPTDQHTIWINEAPETPAVKNRVHLDVRLDDPYDVTGATVVREAGEHPWRVLADAEEVVFCAFPPRDGEPAGAFEIVVDAADPASIASWWADRFGVAVHGTDEPWRWLEDVPGLPFRYWVFNPVPEPKVVPNRVYWQVRLADATVDDLVAAGATLRRTEYVPNLCAVMADPEGNEFRAFEPWESRLR